MSLTVDEMETRLQRYCGLDRNDIDIVFATHFHMDHRLDAENIRMQSCICLQNPFRAWHSSVDYVHLINYTGYSLKSYFRPLPIRDLVVELPWKKASPRTVYSMTGENPVRFEYCKGVLRLFIDELNLFEAIKLS